MSLRFACPHCHQKLSVGAHKAGASAQCPKCKNTITIPKPADAASAAAASTVASALVSKPSAESARSDVAAAGQVSATTIPIATQPLPTGPASFEEYMVYDDDTEIVYDTYESALPAAAPSSADRLLIPRWVVYFQGAALAAVAVVSFSVGVMTGGGGNAKPAAGPKECKLFGTVSFELSGRTTPDDGAVVLAVPQKAGVDEKAPVAELAPTKPPPAPSHRGLQILRELGGVYARTDRAGRYELKLAQRGAYYVLVISNNRKQRNADDERTSDLIQMEKFFEAPQAMLDGRRYKWSVVTLTGDQRLDPTFE